LCFDVSAVFFVGFGAEKRPRAEIFGTLRVAFSERGRLCQMPEHARSWKSLSTKVKRNIIKGAIQHAN
jgi:hypothetical protein